MEKRKKREKGEIQKVDGIRIFGLHLKEGDYIKVIIGKMIYYAQIKKFFSNPYYALIEDVFGREGVINFVKCGLIFKITQEDFEAIKQRMMRRRRK